MMSLKERVKQKVFKSYLSVVVEYHAGGFFVRKRTVYLIFDKESKALFFEREEGLHPKDNQYGLLIKDLLDQPSVLSYDVSSLSNNILLLSNNDKQIKIMPSVFIENIHEEILTEILVDNVNGKAQVFNCVYSIDEHV